MSYRVVLQPSGHSFDVEGRESILDAALRQGINLNYGCSAANCGTCQVLVLSGETEATRAGDYVIHARDRSLGLRLACASTPLSDLVIAAREAHSGADIGYQEIRTTVRRVERLGIDTVLVQLKTPRAQAFRFLAGQKATLASYSGEQGTYHLASCPCDGRNPQFLLKRRQKDFLADRFVEPGTTPTHLWLRGPSGDFTIESDLDLPLVFVAFGDGFGPIKSLIEHVTAAEHEQPLHLFRVDCCTGDTRLDKLCRAWSDALDEFSYHPLPEDTKASQVLEAVQASLDDLTEAHLYVAGPAGPVTEFTRLASQHCPDLPLRSDTTDSPG